MGSFTPMPGVDAASAGARLPSRLGLGACAFGGVGSAPPDEAGALAVIGRAAELGVTHLDTAADYGGGASERIVGRAAARAPGLYFVATKSQLLPSSREAQAAVESARARLGLDSIDLFYIHWPRRGMDPAPMMEGLEACRARGEIRAIGVSNFSAADMDAASRAGRIDYHQLCWNLLWRRPEEEIVPYCVARGIRVAVYSPMAQGLLSGSGSVKPRRAAGDPWDETVFYLPGVWPRLEPIVAAMRELAAGAGASLGAIALRWVLSRPEVATVLAGASRVAQLEANAAAAREGPVEAELLGRLEELSQKARSVLPPEEENLFRYYP
jgi:myo-inositol catabolism protein IolS